MKSQLLLLAALGLGACTASVARTPSAPPPPPPSYDESVATRWVTLADHYSAETRSQQILTRGMGEFRAIRIEGAGGAPVIEQVTIDYEDLPPQVVPLNRQLSPGEGETIRLNGRGSEVRRVIVYSEPRYGGRYSVFGG